MVEAVWLVVLMVVPLVYVVLAVFRVQSAAFAVTEAARQAGRAYATAASVAEGERRAGEAVRLALADQRVSAPSTRRVSCRPECLEPGGSVRVSVRVEVPLPVLPAWFGARARIPVQAVHVATVDRYREAP